MYAWDGMKEVDGWVTVGWVVGVVGGWVSEWVVGEVECHEASGKRL